MVAAIGSFLSEAQTLAAALAGPGPFGPILLTGKLGALDTYHNVLVNDAVGPPSQLVQARDQFLLAALGVGSYVDELS